MFLKSAMTHFPGEKGKKKKRAFKNMWKNYTYINREICKVWKLYKW